MGSLDAKGEVGIPGAGSKVSFSSIPKMVRVVLYVTVNSRLYFHGHLTLALRSFGTKRKHGVSSPSEEPQLASSSTAVDISNSPRSVSSKEEQTKVFKQEVIPTDWIGTSPSETMNTSFSLSASSISKDEYTVEELSIVIKEEAKGASAMWSH